MRSWPPTHNALQLDMPMPPLPQGTIWRPMSLPPGDLPFALQHCNTTCILVSILYSGGGGGVSLCPSYRQWWQRGRVLGPCVHPVDSGDSTSYCQPPPHIHTHTHAPPTPLFTPSYCCVIHFASAMFICASSLRGSLAPPHSRGNKKGNRSQL